MVRCLLLALLLAGCYDPTLARRSDGGTDEDPDAAPGTPPDAMPAFRIDCSEDGDCPEDVVCPSGAPCRVECGDNACKKKIDCREALGCEVDCAGYESCSGEIECPEGAPCAITCSGTESCDRKLKCRDSCACDVTCTGSGACDEAAECPGPGNACRAGDGCTSDPGSCDSCSG